MGRKKEAEGAGEAGGQKKEQQITSYVLRVWDRKPGGSWDILKAGMRTGRKEDESFFELKEKVNISINYMLTAARGKLAKAARAALAELKKENKVKKGEKMFKFNHDENGVMKVKHLYGLGSKWTVIKSEEQLKEYINKNFQTRMV